MKYRTLLKNIALFVLVLSNMSCSTINNFIEIKHPIIHKEVFISKSKCSLPCLFDITAGTTNYLQAAENIKNYVPEDQITENGERTSNLWIYGEDRTKIFVVVKQVFPSDTVTIIELSTHGQGKITSIGDMISAGYKPMRVFRNRIQGPNTVNLLITFGENEEIIGVVSGSYSVNADSPIDNLFLVDSNYLQWILDDIRTIRNYDFEITWLGYASVDAYINTVSQ